MKQEIKSQQLAFSTYHCWSHGHFGEVTSEERSLTCFLFLGVRFSRGPGVSSRFHAFYLLPLWTFVSIFKYTECVYMVLETVLGVFIVFLEKKLFVDFHQGVSLVKEEAGRECPNLLQSLLSASIPFTLFVFWPDTPPEIKRAASRMCLQTC